MPYIGEATGVIAKKVRLKTFTNCNECNLPGNPYDIHNNPNTTLDIYTHRAETCYVINMGISPFKLNICKAFYPFAVYTYFV